MTPHEILKKVKKLDIKAKHLTEQLFGGMYHSAFKGKGMSFSEVRDYQYGDDVRNIDWNVTARTNSPYIKVFEEERELNIMLLIDVSASSYFGLSHQFKIETMIEIAATIASAATNNQDKVGAVLYGEKVERYIAPRKGRQHMLKVITDIVMHQPISSGSDLGAALEYMYRVEKKRSVCFILSDFMTDGYQSALNVVSNRHNVTGIQVYDRFEKKLPQVGLIHLKDLETKQDKWVDTDDPITRESYRQEFENFEQLFVLSFKKAKADTISISTEDDYYRILKSYLHNKSKR